MKTNIVKIEGNKIEITENNDIKEYELEEWVKPDFVKLGDAEVTIKNGKIAFVLMKSEAPKQPVKQESTQSNGKWEDDIVTFETLLTVAHSKKVPFSIKTQMLDVDLEKKYALFKASVEVYPNKKESTIDFGDGKIVFEGHGDATMENVTGDFIKPHFIRMAETRAIVRALRWYTNNGCAEEEK